MIYETWTEEDQALLDEILAEATEAVRESVRLADQLLHRTAPDEAQRERDSIASSNRALACNKILRPLADKALRIHEAAAKKAKAEAEA